MVGLGLAPLLATWLLACHGIAMLPSAPEACGEKTRKYPFITSFQNAIQGSHLCGSTMLSDRWFLTAAHCVEFPDDITGYELLVGTNNILEGGTRYGLDRILIHPKYDKILVQCDLALLRTNISVPSSSAVCPADLDEEFIPVGRRITIIGWGYIDHFRKDLPVWLQEGDTVVVPNRDCEAVGFCRPVTAETLCTGTSEGIGSCGGDSGGPVLDTASGSVVAVVSFGGVICAESMPDLHVRISSHIAWIRQNIQQLA